MLGSQRRTKLKSSEAALLAGELKKPSWESRNEGIHERVSFEDTIWGFDLAGGSFYKTPLRVTAVKKDSRAQKAGIRPGDKLLRINDVDTSTLTIQEAHAMIIESGIHIRLAVSAPDDLEDSYHCWQDSIEEARLLEEQRLREKDEERRRQTHCRTRADWSLQWPWVSKRRIIYKESNCYMVPSKYEHKHRDKFSEQIPALKQEEDIVLHSKKSETPTSTPTAFEYPKVNKNGNISANSAAVKYQTSNEMKAEKLPVPPTILEETSGDEMNNDEELTNNSIEENKKHTPMETQDGAEHEFNSKNVVAKITNKNGQSKEDEELESWNPNENGDELEEDMSEQMLEDMTNGHDEIQEEIQNKILDEVLDGRRNISGEIEGDMEEDITEDKLDKIINDQDVIDEESQNEIFNKTLNGDLAEDKVERGTEEDNTENNLDETLNGQKEIKEESQKKDHENISNGNAEEPEAFVDSVENET